MNYREEKEQSKKYKTAYVDGLNDLIEKRQKYAESVRYEYIKDIYTNPEAYRNELRQMLGWPLVDCDTTGLPAAESEKLSDEDGYSLYRMQFEILEGLKMTGLFFKAVGDTKKPLVIVQHGGLGTPELISGVYGDTSNYNDMLQRVRKHDVHVFAPQLLLWSDSYDVPMDRKSIDARLKRVGSSITAVEVYGITRILDYFEAQSYVSVLGMVGLSYGGFYTLFTSAVDTRIKSAISCSFFNKRDAVAWSDWVWFRSAYKFDDAQVAALIYPRKLCIEIGNNDEAFDYRAGEESFEMLKTICKDVGTDWVELVVFDGIHEFCKSDEPIKRLVQHLRDAES